MTKFFLSLVTLVSVLFLTGCGGGSDGSSAPPPSNVKVVAADNGVTVSWDGESGVEYWVWLAAVPSVTPQNCSSSPSCRTFLSPPNPLSIGGLSNGTTYSVTINGRRNGGPGGSGSAPIAFVPRLAGTVWTLGMPITTNNLLGVAHTITAATSTNRFAAVGTGGVIFASADAVTWSAASSGVTTNLNAAIFGSGRFIAIGDGGVILSSTDGTTWTQQTSGTTQNLYGITLSANGGFIVVGANGSILSSNDGVTWAAVNSGSSNLLYSVAFANNRYVAVGAQGTILTSSDATTWQAVTALTALDLTGISFGAGLFVAIGARGVLLTSADGVTWTARDPISTNTLAAVSYGRQFVTVGGNGSIFISVDGLTWQAVSSGTNLDLNAVSAVTFPTGYVAVGHSGANLTSF